MQIKTIMINSIDTQKYFDKFQHSLMIKTFNKVCIEENFFNIIKAIYDKLRDDIMLIVKS